MRGMRGLSVLASGILVLCGSLMAANVAQDKFELTTASTQMSFRRDPAGLWTVIYYGPKLANAEDAERLAWSNYYGGGSQGNASPASYLTFGTHGIGNQVINKHGGFCVTHADGCVTTELVGEGMKLEKRVGVGEGGGGVEVTHLILTLKDARHDLRVVQHFRAMGETDVIETWVEIANGEKGAVQLVRMPSLSLFFPLMGREFHVQSAAAKWAAEGQLVESSLARGQSVNLAARSGVRDAWDNNPSFMLTVGPKATENRGTVIGGALCWSGMWDISVRRSDIDDIQVEAGAATPAGPYVLDAGKVIELPKFAFTYSAAGKGQVSRNFHRWARKWQLPAGGRIRSVLLNSWEGSYFSFTEKVLHDMMDGVKEMGGELFVLDDGWFGRGKYARDDAHRDRVGLGDWVEDFNHIPHGLVGLADAAKARGLRFGFWVEPEMICTNSWLYEQHPDWIIREPHRPVRVGRGKSQTVLDFSNPAVRDNIFNQLDALYAKLPDLAYIKWDANADFFNYGSTYLDAAHQANLAFDYTKGLYDLLARLRAKYPSVDIQACSSGGGHMEYGFLGYADEFWTSDDSDARERVCIQWSASQFYPASAMAAHVTETPNHQTGRSVSLKYRFDVAMTGRLGFELHPKNMTAEEVGFAKKCVADYKKIRATVQQGDLYRLVSPFENDYAALLYVNETKDEAVVFVLGLEGCKERDYLPAIRLEGIDPARRYTVREINVWKDGHSRMDGQTLGGDALMAGGLRVRLREDRDSAVFVLKESR